MRCGSLSMDHQERAAGAQLFLCLLWSWPAGALLQIPTHLKSAGAAPGHYHCLLLCSPGGQQGMGAAWSTRGTSKRMAPADPACSSLRAGLSFSLFCSPLKKVRRLLHTPPWSGSQVELKVQSKDSPTQINFLHLIKRTMKGYNFLHC